VIKSRDKGDFAVTEIYKKFVEFPSCKRRKVEANLGGGDVTSDGGSLLLRQVDRRLALSGTGLARARCNTHYQTEASQDRRCGVAQHTPCEVAVIKQLSLSRAFLQGRCSPLGRINSL